MKSFILGLTFLKLFIICVSGTSSEESGKNENEGGVLSTIQTIAITFGVMSGLVLCSICTWSWWRRLCFGRTGTVDIQPAQYEDGITYEYRSSNFESLDPRNLNRNNSGSDRHVTFEPLPTLGNLGNLNTRVSFSVDSLASFEMQSLKIPTITTTSSSGNECDVYAEDWFENPIHQNFPRANVEYVQEIGKGWFGKVLEARVTNITTYLEYTKAIIQVQREECDDREQMKFLNDARFYRDITHENILKLLGYCIERSPYMLIYENLPLGDLKFYLITNVDKGEQFYNQRTLIRMAIDVAKGLEFMNQSGYVHGDLAARNCLVGNAAGKVVIGDYGLSPHKYKDDYYWNGNNAWPIRWAAPETLHCRIDSVQGKQITIMSNIWTFGILLWEIFELGKSPYPELTNEAVIDQVLIGRVYILEPPRTPYLTMKTKDTLYNIMLSCWNIVPENRPTISSLLETLTKP